MKGIQDLNRYNWPMGGVGRGADAFPAYTRPMDRDHSPFRN